MQYYINHENKLISIWLLKDEPFDPISIKKFKSLAEQKYKIAIFQSGTKDLTTLTQSLLLHNL